MGSGTVGKGRGLWLLNGVNAGRISGGGGGRSGLGVRRLRGTVWMGEVGVSGMWGSRSDGTHAER